MRVVVLSLVMLFGAMAHANTDEVDYIFIAIYTPNIGEKAAEDFVIQEFIDRYQGASEGADQRVIQPVLYYTTDVLSAVMDGYAHVGVTQQKWTDKDITMLTQRYDNKPMALTITANAFAVIKNEDNDAKSLPVSSVKALFSEGASSCETQAIVDWRALGATSFEEGEDSLVAVYPHSQQEIMGKRFATTGTCDGVVIGADAQGDAPASSSDTYRGALEKVASDRSGVTFGYFQSDSDNAYLAVEDAQGEPILPREDTVYSGQYPLSKVFYAHVAPFALDNPAIRDYVDYLLSDKTQAYLQDRGFMALPAAIKRRNQVILSKEKPLYAKGYR